jgi:hypothetical protein
VDDLRYAATFFWVLGVFFSETSAIDYRKPLQNRTLFAPCQAGFVVSVSLGVAM